MAGLVSLESLCCREGCIELRRLPFDPPPLYLQPF